MKQGGVERTDVTLRADPFAAVLVQGARDGVILLDGQSRIIDVNPKGCQILGVSRDEALGQPIQSLILEWDELLDGFGDSESAIEIELHREGWSLQVRLAPVGGREGTAEGYVLYLYGPAEAGGGDPAGHTCQDGLPTLLEDIQEGYYETDLAGNMLVVNDAFCEALGYRREEIVGHPFTKFTDPQSTRQLRRAFNEVYRTGLPAGQLAHGFRRRDGTRIFGEVTVSLMHDESGKPSGFRGLAHDVTLRYQIEEALRRSEEKYRTLLEDIKEGYYEIDLSGKLLEVNDTVLGMVGMTREEIIGSSFTRFTDPETGRQMFDTFQSVRESREPVKDIVYSIFSAQGNPTILELSASVLEDDDGQVIGFRGIVRDITEKRHQEEQLRKLSQAVEHSPSIVMIAKHNGAIEYVNPVFERITGYSLAEVRGKNPRILQSGETSAEEYAEMWQQLAHGETWRGEFHNRKKNGETFWVSASISALSDADGRITHYIAVQEDITEQKRIELEVLRQKQYFEALFNYSPVAIGMLDNAQTIVTVNPQFETLFGYSSDQVMGREIDDLVVRKAEREEAVALTHAAFQGPVHGVARRLRRDGSLVDVELFAVPVVVRGEQLGALFLYHDISELVKARRQAEEANRSKSTFLANMSHELRTPLNAILGYSELLIEDANDQEQTGFIPDLEKIRTAGEHLLLLINDVLDLSKIEAGRMDVHFEEFDVPTLVAEIVGTIQPLIEKNGNTLTVEVDPRLSTMQADQMKVRQAVHNLLSNAGKFTQDGQVALEALYEPAHEVAGQAWALIRVRDTGIGMTPEQAGKLFQPFVQADSSTTRRFGGTGLGLAITKHYCELMGGAIAVDSVYGEGTTFTIRLPLVAGHKSHSGRSDSFPSWPGGEGEAKVSVSTADGQPSSVGARQGAAH